MADLQALGTRVVVRAVDFDEYQGKLILPDAGKNKPDKGEVVSVGASCDVIVEPGNRVLFSKYAGNEIHWRGESLYVVEGKDLYAVVPID